MLSTHRRGRGGFTLVEMLTVIAIITLLIGILVPALSSARNSATKAAVKAQIQSISTGCEMFKNDEGEFPKSNPYTFGPYADAAAQTTAMTAWEVSSGGSPIDGAHLIVDAMIGRDSLGYDPKPGVGGAVGADINSRWYGGQDANGNSRPRRNPYIKPEGISLSSSDKPPEDAYGPIASAAGVIAPGPSPTIDSMFCPVFIDKFGFPLLYYRANPRATQATPLMQTATGAGVDPKIGDGVYDGRDNEIFTSSRPGPANAHPVRDANSPGIAWAFPASPAAPPLPNTFGEYVRSFRATTYDNTVNPPTMVYPRPVNADSFILLSAGKDGIYGTLDDVANFEVLSEQR